MIRSLALLLLLGLPALAGDLPDPEPASSSEMDLKKMQGTWDITLIEENGKKPVGKETATAVIKKDQVVIREGKGREEPARIKLDARKKPPHIDIFPDKGKDQAIKGIYKFEKGDLVIVFGKMVKERPTKFETGPGQSKIVFKKRKVEKKP
jgi:uncharacterized protein (TIGR03067 family)